MEGSDWLDKLRRRLGGSSIPPDDPRWPAWYREHAHLTAVGYDGQQSLAQVPIVILDAETTGLEVRTDRILCVGALRVLGNSIRLGEKFEAYLPTPPGYSDPTAVSIHGIIPNSHRYTYTNEPRLLADLVEYLGNAVIVGHHIGFDVEMLDRTLRRNGAGPLRNPVIDTADVAKRLRPSGYWSPHNDYSLDALARRYRIPLSDRHTALGDCYITAVLWLKLLTRLAVKLGRDLRMEDVH